MPRYVFLCAVILFGCTTTESPASPAAQPSETVALAAPAAPTPTPAPAPAPAPSEPAAEAPAPATAAPAAPPAAIATTDEPAQEPKRVRPADPATTVKATPPGMGCNKMRCDDGCCGQCRFSDTWVVYGEPELRLTGIALPKPKITPCGPAFDLTLYGERKDGSFVVKSFKRVPRPKPKPLLNRRLGALKKRTGEE